MLINCESSALIFSLEKVVSVPAYNDCGFPEGYSQVYTKVLM